jgi:hypothetical protein
MKKLGALEWLWITHALLGLAALLCLLATRGPLFGLALEYLMLPLGWVLKPLAGYSFLPAGVQYAICYFSLLLNGGMIYVLLRLCFRRGRSSAEVAR